MVIWLGDRVCSKESTKFATAPGEALASAGLKPRGYV
jgi:hypothetical protein